MRLGKIEKRILTYLGQRDENDYFFSRRQIRRKIKYDPDDIASYNARRIVAKEPELDINMLISRIKQHSKIKTIQVSFSRALHRLIKKGLVRRFWNIHIETGVKDKRIEYWADDHEGNGVVILDLFSHPSDFDIPRCELLKVNCCFALTSEGRNELKIRGVALPD